MIAVLAALGGIAVGAAIAVLANRRRDPLPDLVQAIDEANAKGLEGRIEIAGLPSAARQLATSYNELAARLARSLHEGRRFTDNAAHELRTPLTILIGKLDAAIQCEEPGSERQQLLSDLLEEAVRLKGIADRLLLLARSESGRLELYVESVDLSALLADVAEDARILKPEIVVSEDIPAGVEVRCDRSLLVQIVHNLLSNAVKYNLRENGKVWVKLRKRESTVEITVTNTGRPISDKKAALIFEPFFRGDQSHSRRVEGSGLGLSVAREIARAHGGDLIFVSSGADGNVFRVTLPLDPPRPPGSAANLRSSPQAKGE